MPRVQMSYICRKGVMCQDCLTAAFPIVSPPLCLLSRFLANNSNGRLSLDGCFVHQQSVVSICRDGELWVWIYGRYGRWTAGHCALHQHTAEWGREHACYGENQSNGCGTPAEETTQSGGNHWRSCCAAAAELHAILGLVSRSQTASFPPFLHNDVIGRGLLA